MSNKILLVIALFGLLFIGVGIGYLTSQQSQKKPSQLPGQQSVIGVLRSSGLSTEEKEMLKLPGVSYQVTDMQPPSTSPNTKDIVGYFLRSTDISPSLVGSCIEVKGTIPEEWRNRDFGGHDDIPYTYARIAFDVQSMTKLDPSVCHPYEDTMISPAPNEKMETFEGTIIHGNRPAPDIGYDYQLSLKEPYVDTENASGLSQTVSTIDIIPSTNEIWSQIEKTMGNTVELEGTMRWGYAESRYFEVTKLTKKP